MKTFDKFATICYSISKTDKWVYWTELLEVYKNDDDYLLIKTKLDNLINILNINENILQLDLESDIWNMV